MIRLVLVRAIDLATLFDQRPGQAFYYYDHLNVFVDKERDTVVNRLYGTRSSMNDYCICFIIGRPEVITNQVGRP